MEITNEVKAKVFAWYWMQKVAICYDVKRGLETINASNIAVIDYLILKPLSAITDEDEEELGLNKNYEKLLEDLHFIDADKLRIKGYDLPHYLLGGKTLKESGLAIYE